MDSNLIKVFKGEKPSKVPVLLLPGSGIAANLAGTTVLEMRQVPEKMVKAQTCYANTVGVDCISIFSDACYIYEALGCEIVIKDGGPFINGTINDEILENVNSIDFYEVPSCKVVLDAIELAAKENPQTPIMALFEIAFTTLSSAFGTEKVMLDLILEPEKVKKRLEKINQVLIRFAKEAYKKGASIFFLPDPVASGSMISPKHYIEFAMPYEKELIEEINSIGGYAILHICGNTSRQWANMVETGAHVLSLDQIVDFREVRRVVGEDVVLAGKVDPVETLMKGNVEQVISEAKQCIADAGPDNFILMPGCGIPPSAPVDNLKALVIATES